VEIRDRIRGCLIGQCLGDALGMPVEGAGPEICSQFLDEQVNRWFDGAEAPETWTGQYTDDSQLARELLVSFIECCSFDPVDYAARIAVLFRDDLIVGRGIACDEAARKLIEGVHWKEAGSPPPSAGNGTAMRAAPVGLFFNEREDELIEVAHLQGRITHLDPRCSAGSITIALAIDYILSHDIIVVDEFIVKLADGALSYSEEFATHIRDLGRLLKLPKEEALLVIERAGKPDGYADFWERISPFVIPSVLWSIYAFLKHPDSYRDAIFLAIEVGGDVDTAAAMTGALSGARVGMNQLPDSLCRRLHDHGKWKYEDLLRLADKCHDQRFV